MGRQMLLEIVKVVLDLFHLYEQKYGRLRNYLTLRVRVRLSPKQIRLFRYSMAPALGVYDEGSKDNRTVAALGRTKGGKQLKIRS